MTSIGYARHSPADDPGWAFVVGAQFLVAVPLRTPSAIMDALWQLAPQATVTVEELIAILPCGGVDAIDSFALVTLPSATGAEGESAVELAGDSDGLEISALVRGDACVDVFSVGGSRRFHAGGVTPWVLAGFRSVIGLTFSGAAVPPGSFVEALSGSLPVGSGVVHGQRLTWSTSVKLPAAAELPAATDLPERSGGSAGAADADGPDEDTILLPSRRTLGGQSTVSVERRPATVFHRFTVGDSGSFRLDAPALIGRKPRAPRILLGTPPRLIAVASPDHEVSATHLQVSQEGERVVVTDLRSTNGTTVLLGDGETHRLRSGESMVVSVGSRIDIGDGNIVAILPAE